MTIYFMRHASAGEKRRDPVKDARRGLDRSGLEQAAAMGRVLASLEVQLDAILTSPLKRAAQTSALVANEMGFEGKLTVERGLAPQAAYPDFQRTLAHRAAQDVILVVGHNPNLSQFLGALIGGVARPARVELRKGGLAKVTVARSGATLQWLLTPKTVRSAG